MTKAKELTAERLRELLEYDPETGVFTRIATRRWNSQAGTTAGTLTPAGYRHIMVEGTIYSAHRLAFLYMTGAWPQDMVDHINHRRGDNRWVNLRVVTNAENQHNQKNTCGAYLRTDKPRPKPWVAVIHAGGIRSHLGSFHTEQEARAAYLAAKRVHHPSAPIRETTQ